MCTDEFLLFDLRFSFSIRLASALLFVHRLHGGGRSPFSALMFFFNRKTTKGAPRSSTCYFRGGVSSPNVGHPRIRSRMKPSMAHVLLRCSYTLRKTEQRPSGPPAQGWTTPSTAYVGRRLLVTLTDTCYGAATTSDSNVRLAAPRSSIRDYGC